MAKEMVEKIRAAEAEAEHILQDARQQAQKLRADATEQANRILKDAATQATQYQKDLAVQGDLFAAQQKQEAQSKARTLCEQMHKAAEAKRVAVVQDTMQQLLK